MLLDIQVRRKSLRSRLLFWVWLISSLATFVFISIQLFTEYSREENLALSQIEVIKKNYIPSINKGLWDYNFNYLNLQLRSLKNLPYVEYVNVISDDLRKSKEEIVDRDKLRIEKIKLTYEKQEIGILEIGLDMESIKRNFLIKLIYIFLYQGIKTLIVCYLLLKIFDRIIMRHIIKVAQFLNHFDINDGKKLKLRRHLAINDELTMLETSINKLKDDLSIKSNELLELNRDLEARVVERTKLLDEERGKSIHNAKLASLGEMAGGIAHEINNPLAIISSTVQFLKKSIVRKNLKEGQLEDSLETIELTLLRISKIITGLRTVSHSSSKFTKNEVIVRDIFDDVLGLCSEKFKGHGVLIDIDLLGKNFDKRINCDRVQLSQVLLNLVGNAFDAIREQEVKWIKLDFYEEGPYSVISVTDSGEGIHEEIVNKMFNPFFTSKEVGKGTGLGLSISKSIMEKHGGSIEYDFQCKNTRFVLRIPD